MWSSPNRKVFPSDGSYPKEDEEEVAPAPTVQQHQPFPQDVAAAGAGAIMDTGLQEQQQQQAVEEPLIDLTDYQAQTEDEDDADYVPESLREYVQQANARLQQETQGFYSTLVPNSADSHDAEETDYPILNPVFFPDKEPDSTPAESCPAIDLTETQEEHDGAPRATSTGTAEALEPPQAALTMMSPLMLPEAQKVASPETEQQKVSHIGDLDETLDSIATETPDVEVHDLLPPEQFDLDSADAEEAPPTDSSREMVPLRGTEKEELKDEQTLPITALSSSGPDATAASEACSPLFPQDGSFMTSLPPETASKAKEHMVSFLVDYSQTPEVPLAMEPMIAAASTPSIKPATAANESNSLQRQPISQEEERQVSPAAASKLPNPPESLAAPSTSTQEAVAPPPTLSFWGRLTQPTMASKAKEHAPTVLPINPAPHVQEAEQINAGTQSTEKPSSVEIASSPTSIEQGRAASPTASSRTEELSHTPVAEKNEADAVSPVASTEEWQSSEKKHGSPSSALSERLASHPTTASKAREHDSLSTTTDLGPASEASNGKRHSSKKKNSSPSSSSLERLAQSTSASTAKVHSQTPAGPTTDFAMNSVASPGTQPMKDSKTCKLNNDHLERLTRPTSASKAKEHQPMDNQSVASHSAIRPEASASSTVAPLATLSTTDIASKPLSERKTTPVSSRLTQPTTASRAKQHELIERHTASKKLTNVRVAIPSSDTASLSVSERRKSSPPSSVSFQVRKREDHQHASPASQAATRVVKKSAPPSIDTSQSPMAQSSSLERAITSASPDGHADQHAQNKLTNALTEAASVQTPMTRSQPTSSMEHFLGTESEQLSPILKVPSPVHHNIVDSANGKTISHLSHNAIERPVATVSLPGSSLNTKGIMTTLVGESGVARSSPPRYSALGMDGQVQRTMSAADLAVAAARARIRQVRIKEKGQQGKENNGKPDNRPPLRRVGLPKTERMRTLTIPMSPKFATTTKLGEARLRRDSLLDTTLAQSSDIHQKGLRDSNASFATNSTASGKRKVTIPRSPNFQTTAKFGEKRQSISSNGQKGASPSWAQSGTILANQLRTPFPAAATASGTRRVTIPVSPKFHSTIKRHGLASDHGQAGAVEPRRTAKAGLVGSAVARRAKRAYPMGASNSSRKIVPETGQVSAFKARQMPDFSKPVTVQLRKDSKTISQQRAPFRSSMGPGNYQFARVDDLTDAEEKPFRFKAKPVPPTTFEPQRLKYFTNVPASAPSGAAKPFQLESERRHELYQAKRKEKLREEEEQEKIKRQFHAKDFRCPPPPEQRVKSSKAPTTPVPFRLVSLDRHEKFETEVKQKLIEKEDEIRRMANFKANPVPKTTYESVSTPTQHLKIEEERRRKESLRDEERRQASLFKAKPVPQTTYKYIPVSTKLASPKPSEHLHPTPQTL